MLPRLPVGEVFESLINWLKDSFSLFFAAISSVLDFAISALENVLMLDHAPVYPAVALACLIGLLIAFFMRRYKRPVQLAAVGIGVALFAVAEWVRYHQLEQAVDAAYAEELRADLAALNDLLGKVSPADFSALSNRLQDLRSSGDLSDDDARAIGRIQRRIERVRSDRHDDVVDLLDELLEGAAAGEFALPAAEVKAMTSARQRMQALALQIDIMRLDSSLERIDEPQRLADILNVRSHDRFRERLITASALEEPWAQQADFEATLKTVSKMVGRMYPLRYESYRWAVMIAILAAIAFLAAGAGMAAFTAIGFLLIVSMGFWTATMESLALVLSATLFALVLGIPLGIYAARSVLVDKLSRPVLDFMQTMPAFVYLIPAVLFFGLGKVPGAMATLIFAMPPAVRLTSLGIRQVPKEVVEACLAFGATPGQLLRKAQLPIALPTIMAGTNQTIMLALSMVVIGGMIGAGGLGQEVLAGITQLKIGLGFESGIAVVILAIYLDRVTQSLGRTRKSE